MTHTGTLIPDLIDIAEKQGRINRIDREWAILLQADIRKYRQCEASIGGGENPPQCPKPAIGDGQFCEEHYQE